MPFETWLLYLFTCCGIAIVPGPNALLVLTHGAIHGSRKTLFTITGGVLGFAVVLSLCALGLGALIQASATWFTALKIIGGLYLIWLGFGLWRSPPVSLDATGTKNFRGWSLFRQGVGIGHFKSQGAAAIHRIYPAIPGPPQKHHRADGRHRIDLRRGGVRR